MTRLERLQNEFKAHLFNGDDAIVASISTSDRLGARERLRIYDNAYRARLAEVLAGDYPVLRVVLGADRFAQLSARYIREHPSRSFTLRGFGERLPGFLAAQNELAGREFAVELASFEWALVSAFDAFDLECATNEELARLAPHAWPALRIDVHPSVRTVAIRFDTPNVWNAVKKDAVPVTPTELAEASGCVVWRRDLLTLFRSMQPDEWLAWRVLGSGGDFASMCEALLERLTPAEIAARAAMLLRTWLDDGFISALRLG